MGVKTDMKKALAILTAFILTALLQISALAADYSLPEKMQKQLNIGSGLKGSFLITEEGLEENTLPAALNRGQFEIRGLALADGSELSYYIYQTDDTEAQRNKTTLYGKNGTFYLESDFLPETLLSLAGIESVADRAGAHGENPPILSLAVKIFQTLQGKEKTNWDAAFADYGQKTELWLSRFPVETHYLNDEEGRNLLAMSYTIPFQAVKSFLLEMMESFLTDEQIRALLDPLLTEEQKAVYLNENLLYYYREIVGALQVQDDLTLTRVSDTRTGASVSTRLRLPLDRRLFGYEALQIDQVSGGSYTCRLTDDQKILMIAWPENLSLEGSFGHEVLFGRYNAERKETDPANLSLRISLTGTVSLPAEADADGRLHENYDYVCRITQDPAVLGEEYPEENLGSFDPVLVQLNLHFSSKNAQQSPTTAEIQLDGSQGPKKLSLSGTFKTAAPWILTAIETNGDQSVTEASDEQRAAWWEAWLKNAAEKTERMPEMQMPETQKTEKEDTQP